MKDYYYLIPVISSITYINNRRLSDLYYEKFPVLTEMENKRDECDCNNKKEASQFKRLNIIINKFYELLKIPKYILVIQKGNYYYELMTNYIVHIDDEEELKQYEVEDEKTFVDYFVKSDYKNKIFKLFKNYGLSDDKVLSRKISNN